MAIGHEDVTCTHCGFPLERCHSGPCPSCGQVGKSYAYTGSGGVHISGAAQTKWWCVVREYYEKNLKRGVIGVLVTTTISCLGLFLAGPIGVLIGLSLSLLALWLVPSFKIKIREIEQKGGNQRKRNNGD